jgi:hypothetical protein
MMPWPGAQQRPTVEISLPVTADQPTPPAYPTRMSADERFDRLEAELRRLGALIRELTEKQQQMEVRRPRQRWYQRLTTVETWTDNQA